MRRRTHQWFPLLFVLAVLPGPGVYAQVSEKEKEEKKVEQAQELERKTLGLLDEIISSAASLKLPENRAFVLSNAGDLLWARDEKRARNIFWDALNSLNFMSRALELEAAKGTPKDNARIVELFYSAYSSRQELLSRVARRDPQLALDMLRATRVAPPEGFSAGYRLPDDRELEQKIASEVAARDPKRALQLARESLSKGLSYSLLELLYWLNREDQEVATQFAGEIIDKISSTNAADSYASMIAIQLLLSTRTQTDSQTRSLKLDRDQRLRLVQQLVDAALGVAPSTPLILNLREVMPDIEELAPERVTMLKRKITQVTETLNKEQKAWDDYSRVGRNGSPEDMIRSSATANDAQWAILYQQAVVMGVIAGRGDSLREVINEIKDESRRNRMLDALDSELIEAAAYKGDVSELKRLLTLIRLKEQRANAMARMAVLLEAKGQHDDAMSLLNDAQSLIKTDLTSTTQTNALLAIMLAYTVVDPPRAFEMVERTVDRANEDVSKALLVDKFVASGFVKKGEITFRSGLVPLDLAILKYGKGVSALAAADFSRSKAVADRFQRKELRILARLLIVQAVLGPQEAPRQ